MTCGEEIEEIYKGKIISFSFSFFYFLRWNHYPVSHPHFTIKGGCPINPAVLSILLNDYDHDNAILSSYNELRLVHAVCSSLHSGSNPHFFTFKWWDFIDKWKSYTHNKEKLSKRVVFVVFVSIRYLNRSCRVKLVILTDDPITTWFVNGLCCVGLTDHARNWHACLDLENNIASVIGFLTGEPITTRHVNGLLDNNSTKPVIFMSFRIELIGHVKNCQAKTT